MASNSLVLNLVELQSFIPELFNWHENTRRLLTFLYLILNCKEIILLDKCSFWYYYRLCKSINAFYILINSLFPTTDEQRNKDPATLGNVSCSLSICVNS